MANPHRLTRRLARTGAALLGAVLLLFAPAAVQAQDGFLFKRPQAAVTFRAGPMLYAAGGDVFGQMRRDLTLDRGDFAGPMIGGDIVFAALPRLDVVFSVSHADVRSDSEFRDWIDNDGRPIEQETRLRTNPVTLGVRYHLLSRGTTVSRVAWVPTSLNAYVGAAGGVSYYRLDHVGDFIDFEDNAIYWGSMDSRGSDRVLQAFAGGEYWLTPRAGFNAELRHTRGQAKPVGSFRTFDAIDLGSTQASVGLSFRW
jgi:hypothetical protein